MTREASRLALSEHIEVLSDTLLRMAARAENGLKHVLLAIAEQNLASAASVVEEDAVIDALEVEAVGQAINIIALHQPMAADLRFTIGSLKMAACLERVGDQNKSVAKSIARLPPQMDSETLAIMVPLGGAVGKQLRDVILSYTNKDVDLAHKVYAGDDLVNDAYYRAMEACVSRAGRGETMQTGMELLMMAKKLERAGDHCTNLAETVVYMLTGERPQ